MTQSHALRSALPFVIKALYDSHPPVHRGESWSSKASRSLVRHWFSSRCGQMWVDACIVLWKQTLVSSGHGQACLLLCLQVPSCCSLDKCKDICHTFHFRESNYRQQSIGLMCFLEQAAWSMEWEIIVYGAENVGSCIHYFSH